MNAARFRLRVRLLMLLVAAVIVAADQVTKLWVVTHLQPGESITLAPWLAPVFSVTFTTNTGAVFGLFQGTSNLFAAIAVVVIIGILLYVRNLPPEERLAHLILGVMLGGAAGNLVDRFHYTHVIDFIDLNFWPLANWPLFNIADSSIVGGVVMLALWSLIQDYRASRSKAHDRGPDPSPSLDKGA